MDSITLIQPEPKGIQEGLDILSKIATYSPLLALLLLLLIAAIYILIKAYLAKDRKVDELNKALVEATAEDVKIIVELKSIMERYIDAEKSQGDARREFQSQLQQNSMMLEKVVDKILVRIESMYEVINKLKP